MRHIERAICAVTIVDSFDHTIWTISGSAIAFETLELCATGHVSSYDTDISFENELRASECIECLNS
jgi:hypothetical protein